MSGSSGRAPRSLFWRAVTINVGVLSLATALLLVTPVTVSAHVRWVEAVILGVGLVVASVANLMLLRRVFAPLERLTMRMEAVDLLRPGERLPRDSSAEVGRLVASFNAMLDRLEAERQESGRRALAAQESERLRIARELHDEVGQVLTGVLLQLDLFHELVSPGQAGEVTETIEHVRRALDEVRRISRELRPELLEHLGLASALNELTAVFARQTGIDVRTSLPHDQPFHLLSTEAELAIYRIAQEGLTNIARHANASTVEVTVLTSGDRLVLRIVDDGRGFVGGVVPESHGGIRGMRERALLVGAALAITQPETGGAEIRLEVPSGSGRSASVA